MIDSKISTIVETQLPSFITNDSDLYSNFIIFIKAYYEWLEQSGNVLYETKNILNYKDIDNSIDKFLNYYLNEFLQYFPKDSLIDKNKALRVAKELYSSKGTVSSFKFLFKILYNIDCDVIFTKDYVLKPSSGNWYVPKNLTVKSSNKNFLNINNLKIFGESSKSFAIVDNCVQNGEFFEIYISDINRKFISGETIIVVDNFNTPIIFDDGSTLSAKIIGSIDNITIDKNNKGNLYQVGDPVCFYGGVNQNTSPIEAIAKIESITKGEILSVDVKNGGYGFTIQNTKILVENSNGALIIPASVVSTLPPAINIVNPGSNYNVNDILYIGDYNNPITYYPFADVSKVDLTGAIQNIYYRKNIDNSKIYGKTANILSSNNANGAIINISTLDRKSNALSTFLVTDSINVFFTTANNINTPIANNYFSFDKTAFANWYTKLSDAFTFQQIETYSLDSVFITNSGINDSGITPTLDTNSLYYTNDIDNFSTGNIKNYGILAPIIILNSGVGYNINDIIIFSGGSGFGANAIVTKVDSNGGILNVDYIYSTQTLIQEKRNLLLYSENFTNSNWSISNTTLIPNINSPFNTNTASKIIADNTTSRHCINQNVIISSNTVYSFSFYAKAAEYNFATLFFYKNNTNDGVYKIVDLTTGETSNTYTSSVNYIKDFSSENIGNGWWKIKLSTILDDYTTNAVFEIGSSNDGQNYLNYTGDNVSGIYIFGAQLESRSIVTDYQKITDSSSNDFIYISNLTYPLGGMNYTDYSLPKLTVQSSNTNAVGASLTVSNILGSGAELEVTSENHYGEIQSINILNHGENYTSSPKVSLKIQDILIKNFDLYDQSLLPKKLDKIQQVDSSNNITYTAIYDSVYKVN